MAIQCSWFRRPNSIELLSSVPPKLTGLNQSQSKAIHICLGNWKKKKKTMCILSERINW